MVIQDDNIATIAALQMRIDELEAETIGLTESLASTTMMSWQYQQDAEDERATNAQMVAMISTFEVWMNDDIKSTDECEDTYPGSYGGGMLSQARRARGKFYNLKSQHLGAEAEVE